MKKEAESFSKCGRLDLKSFIEIVLNDKYPYELGKDLINEYGVKLLISIKIKSY